MKIDTAIQLEHTVCFRIDQFTYELFCLALQETPGSQAGAMYREIFSRGLASLGYLPRSKKTGQGGAK